MSHARATTGPRPACRRRGELAATAADVDCPACEALLLRGQAVVEASDVVPHAWRGGRRRAPFHGRPRRADTSEPRLKVEALPAPEESIDFSMLPPPRARRPKARRDPVRDFLVQIQGVVVGAGPALRAYDRRR